MPTDLEKQIARIVRANFKLEAAAKEGGDAAAWVSLAEAYLASRRGSDAAKAAEFLDAKMAIPMHYDTFDPIKADPAEFVSRVKDQGNNAVVVAPGAEYTIE